MLEDLGARLDALGRDPALDATARGAASAAARSGLRVARGDLAQLGVASSVVSVVTGPPLPSRGRCEAIATMTSATMPPSLITLRRLQVGERRVAEVRPEGPGAAVGDDVRAELAARRLDRHVGLARRAPGSPR